ncbi:MAG: histidine kinase dimerization/phosphoacceptor domain -containing protein [Bacteroidota bacterium]
MNNKRPYLFTFICVIALLFISPDTYAQSEKRLDSLNQVARDTMSEATLAAHLYNISVAYYFLKNDTAVDIMYKVRDLSTALEEKNYQSRSLYFLGSIHGNQGNFDSAVYYLSNALEIIKTLGDTTRIIRHSNRLGLWLYNSKRFDESIAMYKEALSLLSDSTHLDLAARSHLGLAQAWYRKGDNYITLDYLLKAIKKEDSGQLSLYTRSTIYEFFTRVYIELEHYEEALKFNKVSYQLFEERGFPKGMVAESIKAAQIYRGLKKTKKMRAALLKAEAMALEKNERIYLRSIYDMLGTSFLDEGELNKAQKYFDLKVQSAIAAGDTLEIAWAYSRLDALFIKQKKYNEAKAASLTARDLLLKSLQNDQIKSQLRLMVSIYEDLSYIDSALNIPESSLAHYKTHAAYKNKLLNLEKSDALEELRLSYESERQDKNIQLLAAKNQVQMAQQQKERHLVIASIIGIVLLTLLLVLTYKRYTLKNKDFNTIQAQKTDIEVRNATNQKLINEIHHRVKNNLQIMLSMLNTQGYLLKDDDKAKAIVKESQNRIKSLALIHNNIHHSGRYLTVNAQPYLKELTQNVMASFSTKAERIQLEAAIEDVEISMNFAVPLGLIINELMTCILQYASGHEQEASTLSLKFARVVDHVYELTLSDDGLGFPPDFDLTGSNNFGMQLVEGLTQQLAGSLTISSDCGICFNFTLKDSLVSEKAVVLS